MTQRNKFRLPAIAAGLLWPAFTSSGLAADLNIYAGPQSISPREIIYVTVQSTVQETAIELSYNSDDGYEIQTGTTQQGLVSFEVPAQLNAGEMRFIAKAQESVSSTALVSVFAGPPQNFTLAIKPGTQTGAVDISSSVIRDAFNNPISDLALVSLDWIDEKGLMASQSAQLTQGKIILSGICPDEFDGALILRAAVNSAEYRSSDISTFCREEAEGKS